MIPWLVALSAFFPLAAIYFGALRVEPAGGRGIQQIVGLVLTLVLYLAVWRLLHVLLAGPLGPALGGVIVATALAIAGLPLEARLGYRLVGVKLKRTHAPH